jgi:hypothetical protein
MARSDWIAEVSSAWAFILIEVRNGDQHQMIMIDITINSSIRVKPRWP